MTSEEYENKLDELRKQRDAHQIEVNRLNKEMDDLESDSKIADLYIGKWIKIDRRPKGGYLEYFHVDHWEKRPRGIEIYGKGFVLQNHSVHVDIITVLYWGEIDLPQETTEEEFYEMFDKNVAEIRARFEDTEYIQSEIYKSMNIQKQIKSFEWINLTKS